MNPIKIAVDAMGGDQAPSAVVQGAVLAARELANPIDPQKRNPSVFGVIHPS